MVQALPRVDLETVDALRGVRVVAHDDHHDQQQQHNHGDHEESGDSSTTGMPSYPTPSPPSTSSSTVAAAAAVGGVGGHRSGHHRGVLRGTPHSTITHIHGGWMTCSSSSSLSSPSSTAAAFLSPSAPAGGLCTRVYATPNGRSVSAATTSSSSTTTTTTVAVTAPVASSPAPPAALTAVAHGGTPTTSNTPATPTTAAAPSRTSNTGTSTKKQHKGKNDGQRHGQHHGQRPSEQQTASALELVAVARSDTPNNKSSPTPSVSSSSQQQQQEENTTPNNTDPTTTPQDPTTALVRPNPTPSSTDRLPTPRSQPLTSLMRRLRRRRRKQLNMVLRPLETTPFVLADPDTLEPLPEGVRLPARGPCVLGAVSYRDNDVVLDVSTVSGRHLRLEIIANADKGKKSILTDLGSSNGTWINRSKIEPFKVWGGVVVCVCGGSSLNQSPSVVIQHPCYTTTTQLLHKHHTLVTPHPHHTLTLHRMWRCLWVM